MKAILNWQRPILTFALWMTSLLVAWHDLLPYSVAMFFFAQFGLLLLFGSWTSFGHEVRCRSALAHPRVHTLCLAPPPAVIASTREA